MERGSLIAQKTHLGRSPKVCSVCTITCSQAMLAARCSPQPRARQSTRHAWSPRPSEPAERVVAGPSEPAARCSPQPRGALVNTSVYLKPTKLVDVTLDMLARLAPCLNLGVGELGHKDLLDTIGADNRRK